VRTDLDTDTLERASLTVGAELTNLCEKPVTGVLVGEVDSIAFEKTVRLAAGEQKVVEFTPDQHKDLQIDQPRIWWTHDLGESHLYELSLEFLIADVTCDRCRTKFGIRRVEDYFNEQGHRGFRINGKQVLIRAGGWTDDLFLADTPQKTETQIQYVKHMNLNCIRLEGIWGEDHTLYDLCDRYGILMMVGWSCHWGGRRELGGYRSDRAQLGGSGSVAAKSSQHSCLGGRQRQDCSS
jgi:exo-1,4-beta-D-glucosaminidase